MFDLIKISLNRHRAINIFLKTYTDIWLDVENVGHEQLIEFNTESFEDVEKKITGEEDLAEKHDPITQLVTGFSRAATTEHGGAMKEDSLYMDYAFIFSQSCGGSEEDEEDEEGGEEDGSSIHEQEMEKQKLLFQQQRLEKRGVAEMILLYISACRGVQSVMVLKTLKLGKMMITVENSLVNQFCL